MDITTYNPSSLIRNMHEQLDKVFESGWIPFSDEQSSIVTSQWRPAVDIKEEDASFIVTADVPGVDPEDIEITMENGMLSIKGERKSEIEEEREGYKRTERVRGTFYRRFSLPDTADAEKIKATGKNGVLEIVIPKREVSRPRKIKVKS